MSKDAFDYDSFGEFQHKSICELTTAKSYYNWFYSSFRFFKFKLIIVHKLKCAKLSLTIHIYIFFETQYLTSLIDVITELIGDRSGGPKISGELPSEESETKWQAKEDNKVGSLRHRMINKSGMPLREQFNLWPRRDASRSFSFFLVLIYSHRAARCSHAARESFSRGPKRTARAEPVLLPSARTAIQIRMANGSFPQTLTLNVNCSLNLWQPVYLLSSRASFDPILSSDGAALSPFHPISTE